MGVYSKIVSEEQDTRRFPDVCTDIVIRPTFTYHFVPISLGIEFISRIISRLNFFGKLNSMNENVIQFTDIENIVDTKYEIPRIISRLNFFGKLNSMNEIVIRFTDIENIVDTKYEISRIISRLNFFGKLNSMNEIVIRFTDIENIVDTKYEIPRINQFLHMNHALVNKLISRNAEECTTHYSGWQGHERHLSTGNSLNKKINAMAKNSSKLFKQRISWIWM